MDTILFRTGSCRVPAETIPADRGFVTWRRVKDQPIWQYRYHETRLAAVREFGRNERAYDAVNFAEHGWKIISDTDRTAGLWLW